MRKLLWRASRSVAVSGGVIAVADGLDIDGPRGPWLIRKSKIKHATWPIYKRITDPIFDGFVENWAGKAIGDMWRFDHSFLDVACGDMTISRFLPAGCWYNAFDYRLNDVFLHDLFRKRLAANVALANVESIPLDHGAADFIVCLQAFNHFPNFQRAAAEITRVASPCATLICSIGNFHATMYERRGPHPEGFSCWTFDGFRLSMEQFGWVAAHAEQRGIWIPTPRWLTSRTVQLPITSAKEERNLIFFYAFQRTRKF